MQQYQSTPRVSLAAGEPHLPELTCHPSKGKSQCKRVLHTHSATQASTQAELCLDGTFISAARGKHDACAMTATCKSLQGHTLIHVRLNRRPGGLKT